MAWSKGFEAIVERSVPGRRWIGLSCREDEAAAGLEGVRSLECSGSESSSS